MRRRTRRAYGTTTLVLLSLALLLLPPQHPGGAQEKGPNPEGAPKLDASAWALVDRETAWTRTVPRAREMVQPLEPGQHDREAKAESEKLRAKS